MKPVTTEDEVAWLRKLGIEEAKLPTATPAKVIVAEQGRKKQEPRKAKAEIIADMSTAVIDASAPQSPPKAAGFPMAVWIILGILSVLIGLMCLKGGMK